MRYQVLSGVVRFGAVQGFSRAITTTLYRTALGYNKDRTAEDFRTLPDFRVFSVGKTYAAKNIIILLLSLFNRHVIVLEV